MSTLITNNIQLGQNAANQNNFTLTTDGLGNLSLSSGSVSNPVNTAMTIENDGDVTFTGNLHTVGIETTAANISVIHSNSIIVSGNVTANNFNGNITTNLTLIGDVTGVDSLAGNVVTTLATVNSNVGSFGNTTSIPVLTVNGKGLVTAISTAAISGNINLIGDATGTGVTGGNTTVTLNTVNSNVGSFGNTTSIPVLTVNGKGLVTAISTAAISGNITLVGNVTGTGVTGGTVNTTVITNANLTGPITSIGNATLVAAQTGTGNVFVMQASPTLTTPILGTASATTLVTTGNVTVGGNLMVLGNTITFNSQTLTVEDINITLGNVAVPSDTTASGGGLTLLGTTNKTLTWNNVTNGWQSSENIDLDSGKNYQIAGTQVLNATTLGSGVLASSLTSVGTLGSLYVAGQITSTQATGTAPLIIASTTRVSNLNVATAGNADTVTTNANLTGPITSIGNATSVNAQTGTGNTFVMQTGPAITSPIITGGAANNIIIGNATPSTGAFTSLTSSGATTLNLTSATALNSTPIGNATPSTGAFTSLTSSGATTLNLTSATALNSTPIGNATPSTGAFTTLGATGAVTLSPANLAVTISPSGTGTVAISPVGALTINPTAASTINNTSIGATTKSTGAFTSLTSSGATTLNLTSATALNSTPIGNATPSTGAFTTLGATGAITSTLATGTAPFTIASTTQVANLNVATAGTATTLATPRAIYGNNFDGSAALTQIIASTYGGTGNGFAKLSGPASSEKTFTLPNASDTIACLGQVQTYTKTQISAVTSLTVSANAIAVDLSLNNNFSVTLQATTSQQLSNPTNAVAGTSGQIAIKQNATPSVLNFGSNWISFIATPTVSSTANAVTLLTYYVVDSTHIHFGLGIPGSTGSMVYPGSGIANSTGSAWGTSYTTTGSGTVLSLATSPTLVTPLLGTPTSGNLVNCTGTASNLTAGNVNALKSATTSVNVSSATAPATNQVLTATASTTATWQYPTIPQNSQSTNYTTVLSDSGSHIYHPTADATPRTYTIASNANVAYLIGTTITFVNGYNAGTLTIAISSDTLYFSGNGSTGSRTLANTSICSALKVSSTVWQISGVGLS